MTYRQSNCIANRISHDIYEPLGELQDAHRHADFLSQWQEGHAAYAKGDFAAALATFRLAATARPDDGPCRVFIGRCETLLHEGRPTAWDGAWHFDRK